MIESVCEEEKNYIIFYYKSHQYLSKK